MSSPPGWLAAPSSPGELEWWDGSGWTGVRSPAPGERSGWFANRGGRGWRWWAGDHWTAYQRDALRRPRLPVWISLPVLLGLVAALWDLSSLLGRQLELVALAAIPVLGLLGAFLWLNHVQPLPRTARWHAFAWGAVVAGTAAGYINAAVEVEWGEYAAVVVAAPVGEEILKGLGILMAVRRREIANRLHGAVLACWVAAGFTLAEELVYLSFAVDEGTVLETFFYRGVLTSFVHPLATVWIGLAIGAAVEASRRVTVGFFVGLIPAIALHAVWNAASMLESDETAGLIFLTFVGILAATVALLVNQRRTYASDHERTAAAIRRAALGIGLARHEVDLLAPFMSTGSARAYRQVLPRGQRACFDTAHAAISGAFTQARQRGTITPAEIGLMRDYARATTVARP
jgi:RsiW-degrading membrane proteinase PrsW (M82 family)